MCACALGVIWKSRHPDAVITEYTDEDDCAKALRLSTQYVTGFVNGFDDEVGAAVPSRYIEIPTFMQGVIDGQIAASVVFPVELA